MMDEKLQEEINTAFNEVKSALKSLYIHVQEELGDLPVWKSVAGEMFSNDSISAREVVMDAFMRLRYEPDLSPQETFAQPGVIAATRDTLILIDKVNDAKDTFFEVIQAVRKIKQQNESTRFIQDTLAKAGHGIIKLRQVYRHIHYVNYHPYRVAWSQAKGQRIKKLLVEEAAEKLLSTGSCVETQLNRLGLLQPNEELRIRQPIPSYWLVNITRKEKARSRAVTQKITTSLPIFYVHDGNSELPSIKYATKRPRMTARADKIPDTLYLQSINAYCRLG